MATSITGLGAIDVNGIVSQLMTVERQPLAALQKTLAGIQTKISAFGKLQGQLSAFQTAARALKDSQTWTAATATSSDESSVKATARSGAVNGGYTLLVDQLAQRQTIASSAYAASDTVVGGGTLTLQLGSYSADPVSFTADPARPPVGITVAADATVSQIRDAINAAGAGVTASLVNDASGTRLMIRSADTGASNAFSLSSSDPGLADLAFDPGSPLATSTAMTQAAQDAQLTINGLEISSASNKLDGVVENMVFDLRRSGEASVEVDVSGDSASMRTVVEKFVSAWNDLNRTIADQTKYDPNSKVAGVLQGNATIVSVQRQLRNLLTQTVDGATVSRLSDAGIALQRDGSLAVSASKLDAALANPANLRALFAANGTGGAEGIARRFDTLLGTLLGIDGSVTGATATLRLREQGVNRQQEALEHRMTLIETRLRRQYVALDAQLSQMTSASALIAQRFGQG